MLEVFIVTEHRIEKMSKEPKANEAIFVTGPVRNTFLGIQVDEKGYFIRVPRGF